MSANRVAALALVALVLLSSAGLSQGETESLSIIVHPSNKTAAMSRSQVSALFLRQVTQWGDGRRVKPVNLLARSDLRLAMLETIHGKDPDKNRDFERRYWTSRIFSSRGVPPIEVATEAEVLAYVARNPGAVGYVSHGKVTAQVRALEIRDTELTARRTP